MVLKAFSVLDIKSEIYGAPFFMGTVGEAVRAFKDLVNDTNTLPGRHPADFKLVCIGEFDNEKGLLASGEMSSMGFGTDYQNLASGAIPLGVRKGA